MRGANIYPTIIIDGSDEERGEDAEDIIAEEEWVARVEMERQAIEILGWRMNGTDDKFKTLEDFTVKEIENIRIELEGRQRAKFEMKEALHPWSIGSRKPLTRLRC